MGGSSGSLILLLFTRFSRDCTEISLFGSSEVYRSRPDVLPVAPRGRCARQRVKKGERGGGFWHEHQAIIFLFVGLPNWLAWKMEWEYLYGWINKWSHKQKYYKLVNPRDVAGNAEEEKEESTCSVPMLRAAYRFSKIVWLFDWNRKQYMCGCIYTQSIWEGLVCVLCHLLARGRREEEIGMEPTELGLSVIGIGNIRGFLTRMVYLYYISCLRYTILVGNPRYRICSRMHVCHVGQVF